MIFIASPLLIILIFSYITFIYFTTLSLIFVKHNNNKLPYQAPLHMVVHLRKSEDQQTPQLTSVTAKTKYYNSLSAIKVNH